MYRRAKYIRIQCCIDCGAKDFFYHFLHGAICIFRKGNMLFHPWCTDQVLVALGIYYHMSIREMAQLPDAFFRQVLVIRLVVVFIHRSA